VEEIQKTRESSVLKRRGLLAGATALGAALLAKAATPEKADAADGQPLTLGQANTASTVTSLTGLSGTPAFFLSGTDGPAVLWIQNLGVTSTILSQGEGGASGIQAESKGNAGVVGKTTGNTAGVYGESGRYGVWGQGLGPTGVGLYGAGSTAGLFDGPTILNGNVTVNGSFAASGIKSAIVPNKRGQTVHLYSIEAPESYFEDFGMAATGADGSVTVIFDADFKDVVKTDKYLVFVTAYGRNASLFIESQGDASFVVRDSANTAGVHFGWRIVAKRADVEAPRFMPATPESRGLNIDRVPRPNIVEVGPNDRPVRPR
jgi:hypothetical protein